MGRTNLPPTIIQLNSSSIPFDSDPIKARKGIEHIEEQFDLESRSIPFFWMALLCAVLDEPDRVFFYLNKACEKHDVYMFDLKTTPYLDDYRSDPRFKELLKKMNLE